MVLRLAAATLGGDHASADDVMQEVFLRLIRRRPPLVDDEHARAWLTHVTLNCCRSHLGSAWRRRTVPETERPETERSEYVHTSADDPVETTLASERRVAVMDALAHLKPKQRFCIHLFYFEDLSVADIARAVGWTASTVRSHLHRGRRALAVALKEDCDELFEAI
jgi:RNA polymerase sigma-70 factor (ECF subfamily)